MTAVRFSFAGTTLVADPTGALLWPDRGWLVVADLHLEKGSGLAARGAAMLPPYDTRTTLEALERLLWKYRPRAVVCLGDSFHDHGAPTRLARGDAARLRRLVAGQGWTWITGNHDPEVPAEVGGEVASELREAALTLRHEADAAGPAPSGEVSGHFHPKAAVRTRARRFTGRCFVTDGRRLILPAFGAYTGGLDVHDPAIAALLRPRFRVLLLGRPRIFRFASHQLASAPVRTVA
ncbi:MAG: ligase-associated DNA damage response endonuclease PdeM [Alphaproteobacteria bacterium]